MMVRVTLYGLFDGMFSVRVIGHIDRIQVKHGYNVKSSSKTYTRWRARYLRFSIRCLRREASEWCSQRAPGLKSIMWRFFGAMRGEGSRSIFDRVFIFNNYNSFPAYLTRMLLASIIHFLACLFGRLVYFSSTFFFLPLLASSPSPVPAPFNTYWLSSWLPSIPFGASFITLLACKSSSSTGGSPFHLTFLAGRYTRRFFCTPFLVLRCSISGSLPSKTEKVHSFLGFAQSLCFNSSSKQER